MKVMEAVGLLVGSWDPPGRTLSTVGGCQLSADSGEGTLDSLQTVPEYLKFAQPF